MHQETVPEEQEVPRQLLRPIEVWRILERVQNVPQLRIAVQYRIIGQAMMVSIGWFGPCTPVVRIWSNGNMD